VNKHRNIGSIETQKRNNLSTHRHAELLFDSIVQRTTQDTRTQGNSITPSMFKREQVDSRLLTLIRPRRRGTCCAQTECLRERERQRKTEREN